ncbi:hypothetical protein, partial [Prevotella histicola]|uniref:hypothetical protein n=1 Tax=Prevotella histicola TaxID=470565 RepID=UPI0028E5236C
FVEYCQAVSLDCHFPFCNFLWWVLFTKIGHSLEKNPRKGNKQNKREELSLLNIKQIDYMLQNC